MTIASLNADLLQPQVLTKVVSQIAANHAKLLSKFQMAPGQAKSIHLGHGRNGSYHVYNHTRKIARGTAPGAPANRRKQQPMAAVPFTYPRIYESVALPAELLHNLGRIDDPRKRDEAGEQMIKRQAGTLGEMLGNWRQAMLAGALRGKLYGIFSGEAIIWDYDSPGSGEYFEMSWQRPAGNTLKLDMLGDGDILAASWSNPATNIVDHLGKINVAFQRLTGGRLEEVHCNWAVWNYVIQNESVQNTHGSVNQPFVVMERTEATGPDGKSVNGHKARLNVLPDVMWDVNDHGVEVGASDTYKTDVPAGHALFLGFSAASNDVMDMMEGAEPIAEYDNGPISVRAGAYSYATQKSNPTSTELFILDNAMPVIYIPKAIAMGNCVY